MPIAALVSGCATPAEVVENTGVLREFKGLAETERKRLLELSAKHAGAAIENYKSPPKKG